MALLTGTAMADFSLGDRLEQLTQGTHESIKPGIYKSNGNYEIEMKDGGNGWNFTMRFKLTPIDASHWKLKRTDCNDPETILDVNGKLLIGGLYKLVFAN